MRALVVDDSKSIRSIIGRILAECGIESVAADNGETGLAALEASEVDFVLVDWNMPVMDGFTFLKTVRADPKYDALQIIMCTTETEVSQMMAALEAGANEYVTKPFTKDVILAKLGLLGIVS